MEIHITKQVFRDPGEEFDEDVPIYFGNNQER